MKTEKNILIAFIINLTFSVIELIGGYFTGSIAILSDALHDMGDAASIGISFFLEKKSRKKPDSNFTYGYARYSVIGSAVTAAVLIFGSAAVIFNAFGRILNPVELNYNGIIFLAITGVSVNSAAALITRKGNSFNLKAVNLHMLEDVLGWLSLLIGAIVMKFTGFALIDPIISVVVSVFIMLNSVKIMKEAVNLFLEKTPSGINIENIIKQLINIDGVINVHNIRILSTDGHNICAAMHIVTNAEPYEIKKAVRSELNKLGIGYATLELEGENEKCEVSFSFTSPSAHRHHH